MFTKAMMMFLYTETPLHVGSGRDVGVVDLPIQRDKVTQYPIVQASGLKGCLRSELNLTEKEAYALFGKAGEGSEGEESKMDNWAGAVSPSDARILLFPVRSLNGVFAWVTSLDVLSRFVRDTAVAGQKITDWQLPAKVVEDDHAWVSQENISAVKSGETVTLEEFTYKAVSKELVDKVAKWLAKKALPQTPEYQYWRDKLATHLVILPDNDFRDFALYSTEVTTRIKLVQETKTVQDGALWTEENLPSDSLLYAPITYGKSRQPKEGEGEPMSEEEVAKKVKSFDGQRFQLGGNETIGRGRVIGRVLSNTNGGAQ